ncbi:MAG: hypothetical protein V1904_12010 [Bacteroidota bacterium]
MKKIINVVFLLSVFVFSCWPGPSDSDMTFKITVPENTDNSKLLFSPDEYSMQLERVSVMTGSNSGLEIKWSAKENSKQQLVMKIFLPSTEKFKIWNSSPEKVECSTPELPFTLTEKDFDSVYSARVQRKINAYISLNRETQIMSDQTDVDYLTFPKFSLEISKLHFTKNTITMECKFEGSLTEKYKEIIGADYSISGTYSLDKIKTGIMEVDD